MCTTNYTPYTYNVRLVALCFLDKDLFVWLGVIFGGGPNHISHSSSTAISARRLIVLWHTTQATTHVQLQCQLAQLSWIPVSQKTGGAGIGSKNQYVQNYNCGQKYFHLGSA